jgi:purine-binding chemotaxis protein CheW
MWGRKTCRTPSSTSRPRTETRIRAAHTEPDLSMDTPTPAPARHRAGARVFASFLVGDDEFAVDVRHVQEVVPSPTDIMTLPLAPQFVVGAFNLRGTIVPLLSLRELLGMPAPEGPIEARVAILHHGGIRLGLILDRTHRVLRPRAEEQTLFDYEDASTRRVVAGVLKFGEEVVRVLDLDRMIGLEDIPHVNDENALASMGRKRAVRRRCITFRVGRLRLCFAIQGIHEIVLPKGVEPSPVHDRLSGGLLHIRQDSVPLVRFGDVLRAPPAAEATDPAEQRVVVLKTGGHHAGLLVDAVESIDTYAEDDLMPVPALSSARAGMFAGCLDFGERGHVFMLDAQGVLDQEEIALITRQHRELCLKRMAQKETQTQRRAMLRQPYLWFESGLSFAMPMKEVREIVERVDLIDMPGAPDFVAGMLDLRGRLVTVVNLRSFYAIRTPGSATSSPEPKGPPQDEEDDNGPRTLDTPKIIVLDGGDTPVGLQVDRIESIMHALPDERFAIPQILRHAMDPQVRADVNDVLRGLNREGATVHLLVLHAQRILESVRQISGGGSTTEPADAFEAIEHGDPALSAHA